jgi:hypothetical protein
MRLLFLEMTNDAIGFDGSQLGLNSATEVTIERGNEHFKAERNQRVNGPIPFHYFDFIPVKTTITTVKEFEATLIIESLIMN